MLKNIFYIGMVAILLTSCSSSPKEYSACDCYEIMRGKNKTEVNFRWCKDKSQNDTEFLAEITKCAAKEMGFDPNNVTTSGEGPAVPDTGTYEFDSSKSKIRWTGRKVTGAHSGEVSIKSGNFSMGEDGLISSGMITLDMNSITVTDIKDAKSNADLVGHLKADDFFGVDAHPEASYKITSSELLQSTNGVKTNFKVTGDLTIKGITKSATAKLVAVQSKNIKGNVSIAGAIKFDRTDYGIKYKSGKFFDALGDKVINDEVTLQVSLVAN